MNVLLHEIKEMHAKLQFYFFSLQNLKYSVLIEECKTLTHGLFESTVRLPYEYFLHIQQ